MQIKHLSGSANCKVCMTLGDILYKRTPSSTRSIVAHLPFLSRVHTRHLFLEILVVNFCNFLYNHLKSPLKEQTSSLLLLLLLRV